MGKITTAMIHVRDMSIEPGTRRTLVSSRDPLPHGSAYQGQANDNRFVSARAGQSGLSSTIRTKFL